MSKVLHEYYYVVGDGDIHSSYDLVVEKETDKMYFGTSYGGAGRFGLKKAVFNRVDIIKDRKYGLVYHVRMDVEDEHEAREQARELIYNHMIAFIERFKNYKEN